MDVLEKLGAQVLLGPEIPDFPVRGLRMSLSDSSHGEGRAIACTCLFLTCRRKNTNHGCFSKSKWSLIGNQQSVVGMAPDTDHFCTDY